MICSDTNRSILKLCLGDCDWQRQLGQLVPDDDLTDKARDPGQDEEKEGDSEEDCVVIDRARHSHSRHVEFKRWQQQSCNASFAPQFAIIAILDHLVLNRRKCGRRFQQSEEQESKSRLMSFVNFFHAADWQRRLAENGQYNITLYWLSDFNIKPCKLEGFYNHRWHDRGKYRRECQPWRGHGWGLRQEEGDHRAAGGGRDPTPGTRIGLVFLVSGCFAAHWPWG